MLSSWLETVAPSDPPNAYLLVGVQPRILKLACDSASTLCCALRDKRLFWGATSEVGGIVAAREPCVV
uniref:Uncharacterized protein n=1 Tax=Setaria viridis TaxID=4556 RepID=A0A4U6UGM2_SETVI|nr:hypothetical protein SEVIR_5G064500v2 [Setaria viridis]